MYFRDNEANVDLLSYSSIAHTIVKLIRQDPDSPVTVGLHGDWGAGKSTILKLTEDVLSTHERALCLRFNGWTFQGFEDAKSVLIETILEELQKKRPALEKVTQATSKLLRRVRWLKVGKKIGQLGLAVYSATHGIPPPPTVFEGTTNAHEGDTEYLKEETETVPQQVFAFMKEFRELLDLAKIDQLVVLIDDLDRCLPNVAIETLEAIRLFLFVPRTAFVIAADEGMIEYAVRQHFPDLPASPNTYARNYLEKLIQVPFRIPALGPQETRAYLTLLVLQAELGEGNEVFKAILEYVRGQMQRPWEVRSIDIGTIESMAGGKIQQDVTQMLVLMDQIAPMLGEGTLGNPRQLKRFVNALMLRSSIAEARGFTTRGMKPAFAKLLLAERFRPEFYDYIARAIALSPDGKPKEISELERVAKEEVKIKALGERPKGEESSDVDWQKTEWVRRWARLEPALSDLDLRPLVFVGREKRNFLFATAGDRIDELISQLLGTGLAVAGKRAEVAALTSPDADYVFQALQSRILASDSLRKEPPGRTGIAVLVELHPRLEGRLLHLLRTLPIDALGIWVTTGWDKAVVTPAGRVELRELLREWARQDENPSLKAAANSVINLLEKR
jgi:predicted KAP-like P-loop ATPase